MAESQPSQQAYYQLIFFKLNFTGSCKNVLAVVLNCMNFVVEMYGGYASVAGRDGSFQIGLRQLVGARLNKSSYF